MSTQGSGPNVPAIAVATGATVEGAAGDYGDRRQTDDGVPVGAADVEADKERTGADTDDDTLANPARAFTPDDADADETDDGVPVGRADVEADQERSGAD